MPGNWNLSGEQQQVVAHRGQHLQVVACAGSGKTEAVSQRVAALILEDTPPDGIVAFTFTERAAAHMGPPQDKRKGTHCLTTQKQGAK